MTSTKDKAAQPEKHITVDPQIMLVKPPFDQSQFLNLRITNAAQKLCLYKVLASHPKHYKIKNRVGTLKPAETIISVAKLLPCTEEELAGNKIVIQTTLVDQDPPNKDEAWTSIDGNNIKSTRVKIVTKEEPSEGAQSKSTPNAASPGGLGVVNTEPARIRTIPVDEITFNGPFTQMNTTAFTMFNLTEHFLYCRFQFASDIFRIRPQFSIVDPNKNKIFAVILKDLNAEEEKKATAKAHKLKIEFILADNNLENATTIWQKENQRILSQKMLINVKP